MTETKIILRKAIDDMFRNAGKGIYLIISGLLLSLLNKPSGFENIAYLQSALILIFVIQVLIVCYSFFMIPINENLDFKEIKWMNRRSYGVIMGTFLFTFYGSLLFLLSPTSVREFTGLQYSPGSSIFLIWYFITILVGVVFLTTYSIILKTGQKNTREDDMEKE